MQAGRLKHTVGIDLPIEAETTNGEVDLVWDQVALVKASIEPLRGRERLMASGVGAESDVRIRFRWRPLLSAMTPKWRIRHGDTVYNIQSVANVDKRNREFEVMATTGLNQG